MPVRVCFASHNLPAVRHMRQISLLPRALYVALLCNYNIENVWVNSPRRSLPFSGHKGFLQRRNGRSIPSGSQDVAQKPTRYSRSAGSVCSLSVPVRCTVPLRQYQLRLVGKFMFRILECKSEQRRIGETRCILLEKEALTSTTPHTFLTSSRAHPRNTSRGWRQSAGREMSVAGVR